MSKKIKIMIAQNNELFRRSIAELLKIKPDFEVTGQAANGKELLDLLKQRDAGIVLLDSDMPIMDGKAAMAVLKVRFPEIKVIILSSRGDQRVAEFMSYGASCYLTTGCSVETLFGSIEAVNREGYYFDGAVSKAMLGALMTKKLSADHQQAVFSERETEILRAVCDGGTNKQIADRFHISPSTVDFYKAKIYKKTECRNVTSLLRYAAKHGIIDLR